jgi:hypothetical protein
VVARVLADDTCRPSTTGDHKGPHPAPHHSRPYGTVPLPPREVDAYSLARRGAPAPTYPVEERSEEHGEGRRATLELPCPGDYP